MTKEKNSYYWCIGVDNELSKDNLINLIAEQAEVSNGDLIFSRKNRIVFCVAKGNWKYFYAASLLNGHPICVEHWKQ